VFFLLILSETEHRLTAFISEDKLPKSKEHECRNREKGGDSNIC
jgi:hypothetical protein